MMKNTNEQLTWVIAADADLTDCPGDWRHVLFGDFDPIHDTRESAMETIAKLDISGDWPSGERPVYRLGTTTMPLDAVRALYAQDKHDIGEVLDAWSEGRYGDLMDSETGCIVRPATREEAIESLSSSTEGHFTVAGRDCYVSF